MKGLRRALSFLTRLPIQSEEITSGELARAIPWFPVAGIFIGGVVALVYALAAQGLPPSLFATLAVFVGAAITGGFHEDGLGDTFDALGGGWSEEQMLEIMKDSRQGTFGVLAIVGSMFVRVAALAALSTNVGVWTLVLVHVLARGAVVGVMVLSTPVATSGLGASYARDLHRPSAVVSALISTLAAIGVWGVNGVIVIGVLVAAVGMFIVWVHNKIGGYTGDILGAAEQFGEMAIMVTAAFMVGRGWELASWVPIW
jgi:adenosylcobinamide-GDP ribazoletransferase